jgi:hypothetical protein
VLFFSGSAYVNDFVTEQQSCVTSHESFHFTAVMYFDLLCSGDICVTVAVIERCCKGILMKVALVASVPAAAAVIFPSNFDDSFCTPQMQLSEQKLIEHDLKSARRELVRARDIYVEGMTMQMRARHQREADFKLSSHTVQISGNGVTNRPKSHSLPGNGVTNKPNLHSIPQAISRSTPQIKVVLPAQWHGMQAKIESLGAAGLALAKSRWLRYSTKLQIINGCVDFLSLSKFINNKINTKVIQDPDTESDDDTDDNDNPTGKNKLQATAEGPKYLHLDHIEVLERLRKATSLASSKVLERFKDENMKDYQLEVIDFCKVRVLSSGERIVNQGDKLPYLMIILKGRVAACLPTLQEKNGAEGGTIACEVAGWPLVRALVRHGERNLSKLSRTFHFGKSLILSSSQILQRKFAT